MSLLSLLAAFIVSFLLLFADIIIIIIVVVVQSDTELEVSDNIFSKNGQPNDIIVNQCSPSLDPTVLGAVEVKREDCWLLIPGQDEPENMMLNDVVWPIIQTFVKIYYFCY